MGLPTKNDLAGALSTKTQVRTAMGEMWEYLAGLLGTQPPTVPLTDAEKSIARESLGVGANGFKNRFINPSFLVSQEFESASTPIIAGATIKYVVDQWYASCTGTNITAQQIAGIGEQKYSLQFTGSASNTGFLYGQRLESLDVFDLKNKNCTVSFKAKTSVNKTVSWAVYNATVEDNFTSKTQIASGTINTTSTLTDFQFTFNGGANAGNGLAIEFSTSSLGNLETIAFDEMQIEKSSVATEFQSRPIQQELAMCQRYWETGIIGFNGAYQAAGSSYTPYANFIVPKRAIPTMTIAVSSSSNVNAIAIQPQGVNSFRYGGNAIATGTVVLVATYKANARL